MGTKNQRILTRLLVNVFYNPGSEGTKFDYVYRSYHPSMMID
jgi:hypothetical protein